MDVLIAHHGHCFDGAASAALFTRFVREKLDPAATFAYRGLAYEPNAPAPGDRLRAGATNAILDFRYTKSPLLEWYFDHHVSAFQEPGSKDHFQRDSSGKKFHDGTYGSCTQLLVDVLKARYHWEAPDLADLVTWADIIDAARFPNADIASGLDHPAMEIMAVVQENGLHRKVLLQFAVRHRGDHFHNATHLFGEVGGHDVHGVSQILPGASRTRHLRLTAELAVGADLARDACHFRCERIELVDHRVDGILEFEDFALHVHRDLARKVAARDRRRYFRDIAHLCGEVGTEQVHVVS
jgi:hypothetical protein